MITQYESQWTLKRIFFKLSVSLFTARVRSTREGTVFTGVYLSTFRGGGTYLSASRWGGGTYLPRSGWEGEYLPWPGGGVPTLAGVGGTYLGWGGGVPTFPGLDGGVPPPREGTPTRVGTPHQGRYTPPG